MKNLTIPFSIFLFGCILLVAHSKSLVKTHIKDVCQLIDNAGSKELSKLQHHFKESHQRDVPHPEQH